MRKIHYLALASVIVVALTAQSAVAQFRIDIPRIPGVPKVEKPKREQSRPEPPKGERERSTEGPAGSATVLSPSSTVVGAAGQEQATVAKDSVQMSPFTLTVYRKNFDIWSWVPRIEFRINGPIPSGSQLYAEFTSPALGHG